MNFVPRLAIELAAHRGKEKLSDVRWVFTWVALTTIASTACSRNPTLSASPVGPARHGLAKSDRSVRDTTMDNRGWAARGAPAVGPIIGTPLETFDSNAHGFALNPFAEATNLALAPNPATATWIADDGSPDPGCMKITVPYSGPNQWADLEAPAFQAPWPNWAGKTLHVRIKLDPNSTFSGTPRVYVKTGTAYVFYTAAFTPYPAASGWQEFSLPLDSPAPVPPALPGADAAQIRTYGVDPLTAPEGQPMPTPVTFYVDSFSIE